MFNKTAFLKSENPNTAQISRWLQETESETSDFIKAIPLNIFVKLTKKTKNCLPETWLIFIVCGFYLNTLRKNWFSLSRRHKNHIEVFKFLHISIVLETEIVAWFTTDYNSV